MVNIKNDLKDIKSGFIHGLTVTVGRAGYTLTGLTHIWRRVSL